MAELTVSNIGNVFQSIIGSKDIQPGDDPSYQMCKMLFLYHPLGQKMADSPIKMAQAQKRIISVGKAPEDRVVKAFQTEWDALGCDRHIRNVARQARIYGISSLAILTQGQSLSSALDYKKLAKGPAIAINVYDPLNTAGSLVLSQIPSSLDFQKVTGLTVEGENVHRSRFIVLMNEEPIYIAYTPSSFGYVGRSVYQRALFPLKSFLQTMIADDIVSVKASVIVAMLEQAGSIVDNLMMKLFGTKRQLLKEAKLSNVISIGKDEKIETLNFRNMEGPYSTSRTNILKNIATASDMPAKILENETFVEGFGEGTEDSKNVGKYIDGQREWMQPAYAFFDQIVMYRAWNDDFIESIKKEFPEYAKKTNEEIFYEWKNDFEANWPDVLNEPPSKLAERDKVKLEGITTLIETLMPHMDPDNKATLIEWAADNFNSLEHLFPGASLELDYEAIAEYEPPVVGALGGDDDGEGEGAEQGKGGRDTPPKRSSGRADSAPKRLALAK